MVGFRSKGLTTAFISAMHALLARDMRSATNERAVRGRGRKMPKNPPNETGWFQRHARIQPMVITERMLLRHGWYQRQLRKQGVAVDPNAKNAMVLQ